MVSWPIYVCTSGLYNFLLSISVRMHWQTPIQRQTKMAYVELCGGVYTLRTQRALEIPLGSLHMLWISVSVSVSSSVNEPLGIVFAIVKIVTVPIYCAYSMAKRNCASFIALVNSPRFQWCLPKCWISSVLWCTHWLDPAALVDRRPSPVSSARAPPPRHPKRRVHDTDV